MAMSNTSDPLVVTWFNAFRSEMRGWTDTWSGVTHEYARPTTNWMIDLSRAIVIM